MWDKLESGLKFRGGGSARDVVILLFDVRRCPGYWYYTTHRRIRDAGSIYLPDGRTACFKLNSRRANCRQIPMGIENGHFRSRLVS